MPRSQLLKCVSEGCDDGFVRTQPWLVAAASREVCESEHNGTYGIAQATLFRRLQLALEPLNRIGFQGVGAAAFEALQLARTLAPRRQGKHHRRAALRTKPGLVEFSHNVKSEIERPKSPFQFQPCPRKSLRLASEGTASRLPSWPGLSRPSTSTASAARSAMSTRS